MNTPEPITTPDCGHDECAEPEARGMCFYGLACDECGAGDYERCHAGCSLAVLR